MNKEDQEKKNLQKYPTETENFDYIEESPDEYLGYNNYEDLKKAIQEGEDILSGKIQKKGYHNVKKMFDDILNED